MSDHVVSVHLDGEGNITSIQREKEPQYISGDYPKWLRERVALIKLIEGNNSAISLKAMKINPQYFILYLSKKELTEVGKLLGT